MLPPAPLERNPENWSIMHNDYTIQMLKRPLKNAKAKLDHVMVTCLLHSDDEWSYSSLPSCSFYPELLSSLFS